jgi:hypothetical protein
MSLAGQNQVRHMYVGSDSVARADIATLRGSGAAGELLVLSADGGAVAAGKDFKFYHKTADGIVSSDIIKASNVSYSHSLDYAAKTFKAATIAALATPVVGELHTLELVIRGYGSLSVENEYVKKGFYKVITSDTQESIVDGLITSLNRNFSREVGADASSNPTFSFNKGYGTQTIDVDTAPTADASLTVTIGGNVIVVPVLNADTDIQAAVKIASAIDAVDGYSVPVPSTSVLTITAAESDQLITFSAGTTGVTVTIAGVATSASLIITEKEQPDFNKDKRTRKQTDFLVNFVADTQPTYISAGGFPGVGTSQQVQEMEFYLMGERGDFYRDAGYPHNLDQVYHAIAGTHYNLIEIGYFDEGRDEAKKSKKQVTLAIPFVNLAGNTNINLIIADLNTILGAGSLDALATS